MVVMFFTFPVLAVEKKVVKIYQDEGVSPQSFRQSFETLRSCIDSGYRIEGISADEIIEGSWAVDTALIIFPGGADLPWCAKLNGLGNRQIVRYVKEGGAFLGICAGSYFAGSRVEFALGTPLEVLGGRELAFYPGTVRGPVLAPYDYASSRGARAARITCLERPLLHSDFRVYYNGGGYFAGAKDFPNVTVLAAYGSIHCHPCIVECRPGLGKAILSAVHFEYDAQWLDSKDPDLARLIPILQDENDQRLILVRHLFSRLGLKLKEY